jgi:Helix-turn-helix domain
MTVGELLALPAAVDVVTAGRALGIGRTTAYTLARTGRFPCRVLTVGSSYRVPTADLMTALGVGPGLLPGPACAHEGGGLTADGVQSVHRPHPASGSHDPLATIHGPQGEP